MFAPFTISDGELTALLLALVLISAFASAAEAALFSLDSVRLTELTDRAPAAAAAIRRMLEAPARLLVTLTLLGDAINVLAVIVITWIMSHPPSRLSPAWRELLMAHPLTGSLIVSTLVILIFTHTLPKAVGVYGSGRLAPLLAAPLLWLMKLMGPLLAGVSAAAELVARGFGVPREGEAEDGLGGEDIRALVETGSRQGLLDVTERELLVNLLRSGDLNAAAVMTPRREIVAVRTDAREAEVRAAMKAHDFSRLPVEDAKVPGKYMGVITAKDLLRLRREEEGGKGLTAVMRPPLLAPESRPITDLLHDFRRRRGHLALVVDEFGEVSGLVTVEDVLEEIFGQFNEADDEEELVSLGDNHWKVAGGIAVEDFNTVTGASLPAAAGSTIGGLVLARLGRRPHPGDVVTLGAFAFSVLEVHGIIIHRLEVKRGPGP